MRITRLCCLLLLAGSSFAVQAKMVHRPVDWTWTARNSTAY
jgi:hypothetical protein